MVRSYISMLFVLLVSGLLLPEPAYNVLQRRQGGRMSCADTGTSICIGSKL